VVQVWRRRYVRFPEHSRSKRPASYGRRESVRWEHLIFVGITIENAGFLDIPYWILGGRSGGCVYPSDAVGNKQILREMQSRLPGFDNNAVIQAMGMISGGITVWERERHDATA
jgi:hypothetical protein